MIGVIALAIVVLVAAFVAAPLMGNLEAVPSENFGAGDELWTREKAVAVLAITEADFDRATGKLSENDYLTLRSDYEGRALQAMDELEKEAPVPSGMPSSAIRFCSACGARFAELGAFCGGCGRPRDRS